MKEYICEYAGFTSLIKVDEKNDILIQRLKKELAFYYSIYEYSDEVKYDSEIEVIDGKCEVADIDTEEVCIHSSHSRNKKILLDGSSYTQEEASIFAQKGTDNKGVIYYYLKDGTVVEADLYKKKVRLIGKNLYDMLVYIYETLLNNYVESMGGILLHAASCSLNGKGYILCGKSGAGKTTLLFDLIKAGARFHSNDRLVIFEKNEKIESYSIPIPVNVPLRTMKNLDGWKDIDVVINAEEDCKIRFKIGELDKLFGDKQDKAIDVGTILCVKYSENKPERKSLSREELIEYLDLLTPYDECHPKWLPMFSEISDNQINRMLKILSEKLEVYQLSGNNLLSALLEE